MGGIIAAVAKGGTFLMIFETAVQHGYIFAKH
jgi:hypothetical protein